MAVAKEYLFEEDDMSIGLLGKAIGHAARSNIIHALLENDVLSYTDIQDITPLAESTVSYHLRMLEKCQLLKRTTMANNMAGFCLDRSRYLSLLHAMGRRIKPRPRSRTLELRETLGMDEVS